MKKINSDELKIDKCDVFIGCSNFEERSKIVVANLSGVPPKSVLCFYDNNYCIDEKDILKTITEMIPNCFHYAIKDIDAINVYDYFYKYFTELNSKDKVVIDISTFSREILLVLFRLLSIPKFNHLNVDFYYTPCKSYSLGDDEKKIWLSKGVGQIRSVFGYPGIFSSFKKTLLVLLTGFESDRAQIIIDEFEPHKLILGMAGANNSISDSLFQINKTNYDKLIDLNGIPDMFEFSCVDIFKTKDVIKKIIDDNKTDYNIVISPLNNKISTIGVALAVIECPEAQICYASANVYNQNYSEPADYVYKFCLNEILFS